LPPPETKKPAEIDLSDPAIIDALDAREKADRAIADAVEAQRSAKAAHIDVLTEAPSKKPSLIPTTPDEAKALAQKLLDKILSWLTSPSFLAQVAAIVLVWILAPIFSLLSF